VPYVNAIARVNIRACVLYNVPTCTQYGLHDSITCVRLMYVCGGLGGRGEGSKEDYQRKFCEKLANQ
jgi:hypothetical protein